MDATSPLKRETRVPIVLVRFDDLCVRRCLFPARLHMTFPEPVLTNRFDAPLWVLSFCFIDSIPFKIYILWLFYFLLRCMGFWRHNHHKISAFFFKRALQLSHLN